MQVKGDRRLAVIGASAALEKTVGAGRRAPTSPSRTWCFTADRAALDKSLPKLLKVMPPSAILWIAYPKLSSKITGDLSRDIIAGLAPEHGLDTVSQIAIDEDWSALRLKRVT